MQDAGRLSGEDNFRILGFMAKFRTGAKFIFGVDIGIWAYSRRQHFIITNSYPKLNRELI